MNSKNALMMVFAVLLIVINLFDGGGPISSVAESDPENIQNAIDQGGEALGSVAFGSQSASQSRTNSFGNAGRDSNSSSFDEDSNAPDETAADEPRITDEAPASSDAGQDRETPEGLRPEDVEDVPFDPTIR